MVEDRLAALTQYDTARNANRIAKGIEPALNSPSAKAPITVSGMMCMRKSGGALLARLGCVDLNRLVSMVLRIDIHADARLQDIDDHEPDDEGERP